MKSCAQDPLFQVTSLLPGANTGEQAVQHLLQLHRLVRAGQLLDQRTQASEPFPRLRDNVEKGAEASSCLGRKKCCLGRMRQRGV